MSVSQLVNNNNNNNNSIPCVVTSSSQLEINYCIITYPRFPEVGKVEFVFGPRSDAFVSVTGFKSDVTVPVDEGDDQLVRSDSFENFNKLADGQIDTNENGLHPSGKLRVSHQPVDHSKGPVDGSLYATVNKQKETTSTSSSRLLSNGPTSHVVNGNSINSSMDSGISSTSDHHGDLLSRFVYAFSLVQIVRSVKQSINILLS
ncbi:hypothetical protein LOTGIDRAFT_167325 [Lottia gigantea]|uniref:Uncharacterized protein n=1 Tax=Lottia gigantea TaxID=225164 RepID=V3Z675_LOTGI|nr:hypothetical protein LOTGIDRAFT_167325 [Lottia gigantea]ESO86283.1 hypothetical protein LOTGIDRAFT_167325 [Lottia gigantea]